MTQPLPDGSTPDPQPVRLLVADDHPAVRAGLVALLESDPGVEVVAQAADGDEALRVAREHRPDVALTDVRMPGATGIDITPALRDLGARVLVISAFDLDAYVLGALAAGADGYLVKTEEPHRILQAVHAVASGDAVLSPTATRTVVAALRERPRSGQSDGGEPTAPPQNGPTAPPQNGPPFPPQSGPSVPPHSGPSADRTPGQPELTRREEEVLRLLARGLSNQQIARELVVEMTTVKTHITHVLTKLQADSRVQAALWWHRHRG